MKYTEKNAFKAPKKKTIKKSNSGLTECPHCGKLINVGEMMGRMAAGHPKNFSPEEKERRRQLLAKARENRWKPETKN